MFERRLRSSAEGRSYRTAARSQAGLAVAGVIAVTIALIAGATLLSSSAPSLAGAPAATFSERFSGTPQADCATATWPYLSAECLRTPDGSRARPARMIMVGRKGTVSAPSSIR